MSTEDSAAQGHMRPALPRGSLRGFNERACNAPLLQWCKLVAGSSEHLCGELEASELAIRKRHNFDFKPATDQPTLNPVGTSAGSMEVASWKYIAPLRCSFMPEESPHPKPPKPAWDSGTD